MMKRLICVGLALSAVALSAFAAEPAAAPNISLAFDPDAMSMVLLAECWLTPPTCSPFLPA